MLFSITIATLSTIDESSMAAERLWVVSSVTLRKRTGGSDALRNGISASAGPPCRLTRAPMGSWDIHRSAHQHHQSHVFRQRSHISPDNSSPQSMAIRLPHKSPTLTSTCRLFVERLLYTLLHCYCILFR